MGVVGVGHHPGTILNQRWGGVYCESLKGQTGRNPADQGGTRKEGKKKVVPRRGKTKGGEVRPVHEKLIVLRVELTRKAAAVYPDP